MTRRLLTIEQAAERLNVTPNYVRRRLIFEKRIPYVKIGRHVRIEAQAIENFIEQGRVDTEEREAGTPFARRTLADLRREQLSRWRTSASTP
jgi:excisionase family DNA binding protein